MGSGEAGERWLAQEAEEHEPGPGPAETNDHIHLRLFICLFAFQQVQISSMYHHTFSTALLDSFRLQKTGWNNILVLRAFVCECGLSFNNAYQIAPTPLY